MNRHPRVSIGIPVFNAEEFLAGALDSVLGQTFQDFEVILSDNASTDRTAEICRAYADRDPRIRYSRNDRNLGAAPNFNRVFELSSGEYFGWLAHDDLYAPEFLSRCVDLLDADPDVVLCYSKVRIVDAAGNVLREYSDRLRSGNSPEPCLRFRNLVLADHWCREVFGLMRADALRKTRLIGHYAMSDRPLLAELAILGRFRQIDEFLFLSREHARRSVRLHADLRSRAAWFDPSNAARFLLPHWRILAEYAKTPGRFPLPWRQRACCYVGVLRWARWHWRELFGDVRSCVPRSRVPGSEPNPPSRPQQTPEAGDPRPRGFPADGPELSGPEGKA